MSKLCRFSNLNHCIIMKIIKYANRIILFFLLIFISNNVKSAEKPNVIVIITDDLGWRDVSYNGSQDISTPAIDNLAEYGVVFNSGYVTHPYCSPSRAGLITGRYQQRFGHEYNVPYEPNDKEMGTPLNETFLPELLKENGYKTIAIGKWHLGDHECFWPINRGFENWFGFTGGGYNYYGIINPNSEYADQNNIYRNGEAVDPSEITYLTDDFTREAVSFIEENKDQPFFMYLAYNAPHAPDQAPKKYLAQTRHIEYGDRSVYAAMVQAMDEGIAKVISTLKKHNLYGETLIIFLSDNGGCLPGADNLPYRGHKGMLFEGGIRVPFLMSWPNKINPRTVEEPIISLDIFPTVCAATNTEIPSNLMLDGKNLLPFVQGETNSAQHEAFYWRVAGGAEYAVRKGEYKIYKSEYKDKTFLFNLSEDQNEKHDISEKNPAKLKELMEMYEKWNKEMEEPLWTDPHLENIEKEEKEYNQIRQKALPIFQKVIRVC
jgi:arylsulfatase A-like enzyme